MISPEDIQFIRLVGKNELFTMEKSRVDIIRNAISKHFNWPINSFNIVYKEQGVFKVNVKWIETFYIIDFNQDPIYSKIEKVKKNKGN